MCWTWKVPAGAANSLFWCPWLGWKLAYVRSHHRGFTLASSSSSSSSLWEIRGQEWNQSLTEVNLTEGRRGKWECQTMHPYHHFEGLKLHENQTCKDNNLNILRVPNSQKFPQETGMSTLQKDAALRRHFRCHCGATIRAGRRNQIPGGVVLCLT